MNGLKNGKIGLIKVLIIGLAWQERRTSLDEGRSFRLNNFQKVSNEEFTTHQFAKMILIKLKIFQKNKIINFDNELDIDASLWTQLG